MRNKRKAEMLLEQFVSTACLALSDTVDVHVHARLWVGNLIAHVTVACSDVRTHCLSKWSAEGLPGEGTSVR